MTKTRKIILLNAVFIMATLASNIMAAKMTTIAGISFPAGVYAFPISFLVTDVINEVWGKKEAGFTVKLGFAASIVFTLLTMLAVWLPAAGFWTMQTEYAMVLAAVPRITIAGLTAFIFSQNTDLWIFDRLKALHKGKHLWIRNNVSTMAAQLLDSLIFIVIAFYGTMPVNALVAMVFSQWAVKLVLATLDTPFVYWGVKKKKKGVEENVV